MNPKQEEKAKKELARRQKQISKPTPAFYLVLLMIVLTIIYIVDEVASNINSTIQPYILFDLFNIGSRDINSQEYTDALNYIGPITVASQLMLIISPFYKSLADRFGRRIFLMINTVGMGVGMLVVMTSNTVIQYIIGMIVMLFFTPNDMQVLYIMESAPKEKRATLSFVAKGIALISVSVIGILARVYLDSDVEESWKSIYFIPVIVAIAVGVLSFFFVRETPVFLEQRIKLLSLTPEEKAKKAEEAKKNKTAEQGGVIQAVKFIFTNKQLRWILISGFIFFVTTFYTSYYTTMLEGAMSTDLVTTVLIVYPFFNGFITIISGIFSDKLGRKNVCILLGSLALVGLLLFILACQLGWGPYVAGVCYGCSIGGLWSMSDTLILTMTAESTPSGMRSSVMGTIQTLIFAGSLVGILFFTLLQNFMPVYMVFLVVCIPFMALSLILLMTKVKETKNVNLDEVNADTFK